MGLKAKLPLLGLVLIAGLLVGCGVDGEASTNQSRQRNSATASSSTTPRSTGSTADVRGNVAELDKELIVVTVADGDLVAFDLTSEVATTIAKSTDLSDVQGVDGRFEGFDVSPDRTTVMFTFGNRAQTATSYRIYTVPIDGSAAPTQRLPWKPDDEFVGAVRYSPTGDTVVVARDTTVTVIGVDDDAWSSAMSVEVPYPPTSFIWSPDGDLRQSLVRFDWNAPLR